MMSKKFDLKTGWLMLAAIAISSIGQQSYAQDDAPAKLPTADEVIAKYVQVTGGLEKYKALKTMRQQGTMSIPVAGINGTMNLMVAGPNKVSVKVELPGAGNESGGSNGEIAWSDSTMTGTRLLEGKEKEQTLLEADFRRIYDPNSVYKSLEVTGVEEIDGEKCYEVIVTKNSGDIQKDYYSIKTGLQTRALIKAESPMGVMEIEATPSNYKDVEGIKFPHKVTQKLPNGMEIVIEFDKIEFNPELPADAFAVPEKVQKLVDQQKENEQSKESVKPEEGTSDK